MFFLGRLANWYYNRQRTIFHYRDGKRWHRADPIVVGVRLEEVCPTYLDLLQTIQMNPMESPPGPVRESVIAQRRDAGKKLASAARGIFGLEPLSDTGGVTDGEAIGVITNYFLFMESLARAAQLFPDWPDAESPSHPASPTTSMPVSGTAVG